MKEEVEKLIEMISEETGMGKDKIKRKIEDKEEEFSGLISEEGAAHIVAKEQGIRLNKGKEEESLDIGNIVTGMNNVTVTGKIQRIFDTREFESDGEKGKVANLILADETGDVRVSLWNEEVDELIEEGKIEEGDVIKIQNGYVKEDNRENAELRLGRSGQVLESDEEISVQVDGSSGQDSGRSDISDLGPGDRGEVRANLVKIFTNNPFFRTCPECDKRVEDECEEHGEFKVNMALAGVLDDGTENIRCVFFREQAEKVLGMDTDEAWEKSEEGEEMETFVENLEGRVGNEFVVGGRVEINDFFGRQEFIANSVDEVNPKEEAEKIVSEL
ncbi:MAG: DUF2240 family protein [Candidatus Aenigmatarchaeota archaeon]